MKLQDYLILYEQVTESDGTGGQRLSDPVEIGRLWGNVKPLTGNIAMTFQQLTGTQGYEVTFRTDFERKPDRVYYLEYEGIYGNVKLFIHSVQVDKHYTKLICKSENRLPVEHT